MTLVDHLVSEWIIQSIQQRSVDKWMNLRCNSATNPPVDNRPAEQSVNQTIIIACFAMSSSSLTSKHSSKSVPWICFFTGAFVAVEWPLHRHVRWPLARPHRSTEGERRTAQSSCRPAEVCITEDIQSHQYGIQEPAVANRHGAHQGKSSKISSSLEPFVSRHSFCITSFCMAQVINCLGLHTAFYWNFFVLQDPQKTPAVADKEYYSVEQAQKIEEEKETVKQWLSYAV